MMMMTMIMLLMIMMIIIIIMWLRSLTRSSWRDEFSSGPTWASGGGTTIAEGPACR
jgi:hypothetical protein